MSTAIAVVNQNEQRWTPEQIQILKNTVCKGANDDEFKIFCYAVQRTGLDPFMKQIHAVKRWNNKTNREDMSIQVGIDGYRLIADRTGFYAGNEEAIFDNEKVPTKATVTVYKMVQNQRCAFTASARWNEYYPGDKQGFMWKKMPCVMLGKVAEAIALRKAFPAELSGVYTNEEMAQADLPGVGNADSIQTTVVKKEFTLPPGAKEVGQRIKNLKLELGLSDEEIKAEIHRLNLPEWKLMTIEQMNRVVQLLEDEKAARAATSNAPSMEPREQADWEKEV